MAILKNSNVFILETKNYHYVLGVDEFSYNRHVHWGKKCPISDYDTKATPTENISLHPELDQIKQEYTLFGGTMYRECSLKVTFPDGCRELETLYKGYEINDNELCITFKDKVYPFEYAIHYKVYEDYDIIVRYTRVKNNGNEDIILEKIMSGEIALPDTNPYYIKNTNGAWGAECTQTEALLDGGSLIFESRRGTSSHTNSPYLIAHKGSDEKKGEVYYAMLAYSGSFKAQAYRDLFGTTRLYLGINDFDSEYALKGGEEFRTPELIIGMSEGFGNMTRNLNHFGIELILPKYFNNTPLPVLYNSWEATAFDVNTTDQTKIAKQAAKAGCELFVMDDGWFGARNDDHAGLGDWVVNKDKFPNGLDELIKNVNDLGMDFGLWFEPEMVNPDSDLYRKHPDWAYHYDTRTAHELRNQLVLNMTKPEVQKYIYDALDKLLTDHNIKYIKWDMNRPISEGGAENLEYPKEHWYRFALAFYSIVDKLRAKHPDVQFESCSSGGGRCDWGALKHFDMVWTSDNTDAIDRITIQKGYQLTRPTKTMRAWVTDVNWYNRDTPLDFRFNIAMRGALSLGGNLNNYSDDEIAVCKKYTDLYKEVRNIIQFGDLYRLLDYDRDEINADLYLTQDKNEGVLFIAAVNTRCVKKPVRLHFDGLNENKVYVFDFGSEHYEKSGAYLMNVGIQLDVKKQYYNKILKIKALD